MSLFNIKGGDYVAIRDLNGNLRGGRAHPLLLFPDHVVLAVTGRPGNPIIADASNIVTIRSKGERIPRKLLVCDYCRSKHLPDRSCGCNDNGSQ